MNDIFVEPATWSSQSAALRDVGSRVTEVGTATRETMTGNPYGMFTPFFSPEYTNLVEQFNTSNNALGKVLEQTADDVDSSAKEFSELEGQVAEDFRSLLPQVSRGES